MKYRRQVKCDVYNKYIGMPSARIEWGNRVNEGIHLCHHESSLGFKSGKYNISDMI